MSEQIHKSAIRTVPAYQTVDGQKFHSVEEAQEHTRNSLTDSIIAAAVKADPQFARLDPELLRKFCRAYGTHLGNVMGEPFKPLPFPGFSGGAVARPKDGEVTARIVTASETMTAPYTGKTDFGVHPLDQSSTGDRLKDAMRAVSVREAKGVEADAYEAAAAAALDRHFATGN